MLSTLNLQKEKSFGYYFMFLKDHWFSNWQRRKTTETRNWKKAQHKKLTQFYRSKTLKHQQGRMGAAPAPDLQQRSSNALIRPFFFFLIHADMGRFAPIPAETGRLYSIYHLLNWYIFTIIWKSMLSNI